MDYYPYLCKILLTFKTHSHEKNIIQSPRSRSNGSDGQLWW